MIDAHCHLRGGGDRHLICLAAGCNAQDGDVAFFGTHPWQWTSYDETALALRLAADDKCGVGEIGLDRLKEREIPLGMRETFDRQLKLAARFHRPVVLHGAKCWGEVVKATKPFAGEIPAFLFHGFSRSGGLLPDIEKLNGFVSVGPAILNDHAENYRELFRTVKLDMLLAESDNDGEEIVKVADIIAKLAELRSMAVGELEKTLDENALRFTEALQ